MIQRASTMPNGAGRSHATTERMVADPFMEDSLAAATALSLDLSVTMLPHLERAGGISKSRASRWAKDGRGSPLYEVTRTVYALMKSGQHAGAIAAHVLSTLAHALMPISDTDLVSRFWKLMGSECDAEGRENRHQATYALSGDLAGLERATLDEAGVAHELAATIRELRRRGIDPRKYH